MKRYHIAVSREGRFWVAVVEHLRGGSTEVRSLSALEGEVRDLISALTDTDPDSFVLSWDYDAALPASARDAIAELNEWRQRMREAESGYARTQSAVAKQLSEAGVSVRDSASFMKVSPARVSRIAPSVERTIPSSSSRPKMPSRSSSRSRGRAGA